MKTYPYIAILGPTASGKSDLAMKLAKKLNGEIVCCDSVQLYKDFDIGSNKPTKKEQEEVPHHMLDMFDAGDNFDAFQYADKAKTVIRSIYQKDKLPIVVVGTGLYFRALEGTDFHQLPSDETLREELNQQSRTQLEQTLKSLDPERFQEIHEHDTYRLIRAVEIALLTKKTKKDWSKTEKSTSFAPCYNILLSPPRKDLHEKIALRVKKMLKSSWIEEVKGLLDKGYDPDSKALQSIGYRQIVLYLLKKLSEDELEEKILFATRQYAKRQITWFKKTKAHYAITNSFDFNNLCEKIKDSINACR